MKNGVLFIKLLFLRVTVMRSWELRTSIPVAGHLGIRKTQARFMAHFYWPKLHQDVVEFCKTCHTCQMVGKPQPSIKPAPMIPIPAFDEPFTRVLVDCVGPLPRTKTGHQYLLTIMDLSTRFPEAIPLRKITAKVVVEALMQFFTRYGLPKEVQSDQGSNFMSGVFQEVLRELGIKQLKSSAYHPQSQGALERYHQTLKNMIRAYCEDFPEDWDKGIPFLLFATRDSPNESTDFTPFELVCTVMRWGGLWNLLRRGFCQTRMRPICSTMCRILRRGCRRHVLWHKNIWRCLNGSWRQEQTRNLKSASLNPAKKC